MCGLSSLAAHLLRRGHVMLAEKKFKKLSLSQEETEIRKQRSDHCKYKYLMLRNGIKVDTFPDIHSAP